MPRPYIQIVISESHKNALLHMDILALQISEIKRTQNTGYIQTLRNAISLNPPLSTVVNITLFANVLDIFYDFFS
jgi:hypothetical protein